MNFFTKMNATMLILTLWIDFGDESVLLNGGTAVTDMAVPLIGRVSFHKVRAKKPRSLKFSPLTFCWAGLHHVVRTWWITICCLTLSARFSYHGDLLTQADQGEITMYNLVW